MRKNQVTRVLNAIRDGHEVVVLEKVVYPGWIKRRLTPKSETKSICDPGNVEFFLDSWQGQIEDTTGHHVYSSIVARDLLQRSLSLGHLKWYQKNPRRIPTYWQRQLFDVYAWASVVEDVSGKLRVPHLSISRHKHKVEWKSLDNFWGAREVALLFESEEC